MPASFSEQTEALCVDRQKHFQNALLKGKPLRPHRGGEWTIADLVFLKGTLNHLMKHLRECSEDELRTPLSEVFG